MKEIRYMISDAAKKTGVESHVLRHWEDELALPIQRNEMGHRYYTNEDIQMFRNIKCLKDQGFQLKAIRLLLPEIAGKDTEALSGLLLLKEELNIRAEEMEKKADNTGSERMERRQEEHQRKERKLTELTKTDSVQADFSKENISSTDILPAEQKMLQLQEIVGQAVGQSIQQVVGQIVRQAVEENNRQLVREMSCQLSKDISEDLNGLLHQQEVREEERFHMLDAAIRERQQKSYKEAAVTSLTRVRGTKARKRLFQRNK